MATSDTTNGINESIYLQSLGVHKVEILPKTVKINNKNKLKWQPSWILRWPPHVKYVKMADILDFKMATTSIIIVLL